jgi:hypothetical protein
MMKMNIRIATLAALLGAAAVLPAFASGTYPARPPRPPSEVGGETDHDREKYRLGQKIYAGKIKLTASADAQRQRPRLEAAQAQLPAGAKTDLVSLAGRLTEDQLAALEYFVKHRFAMKK